MTASRPLPIVLPTVLIIVGMVILLANLGTLPEDVGWRLLELWPLLLVLLGLQLLIPRVVHGSAMPVLTILVVAAVALGALGYAVFGTPIGGSYTRFQSTSPLAGVTHGRITVDAAAEKITITARDIGDQLYQARVDYAAAQPKFSYADGDIHVSSPSNIVLNWGRPREIVDLVINPSVEWTIVIDAAGTATNVDLSSGNLRSFKLNGAGGNVTVVAGAPHGVVTVGVSGVGIGLTVKVPASAEYQVTADGIATSIGGKSQTPGWSTAQDRFDVSVSGVGAHAIVTPGT